VRLAKIESAGTRQTPPYREISGSTTTYIADQFHRCQKPIRPTACGVFDERHVRPERWKQEQEDRGTINKTKRKGWRTKLCRERMALLHQFLPFLIRSKPAAEHGQSFFSGMVNRKSAGQLSNLITKRCD